MGVKRSESSLLDAAIEYVGNRDDSRKGDLTKAALVYAKEKKKAADKRDKWKEKKRLGGK